MLEAIGPRTKIVFVCHPNNPTGTMNTRAELDAFLDAVPEHVLVVLDQAYREYVGDPEYPDAIEEYFRAGRRVAVLRTFSKIYGLAGLRVGYMVAPAEVVRHANKVKRAFDVSSAAQSAALASLDDDGELERRRAVNARARPELGGSCAAGLRAARPGRRATSSTSRPAATRGPSSRRCSAEGVIVRPLHGFGAPTAFRVTYGTPDDNRVPRRRPRRARPAPRGANAEPRATAADPRLASGRSSARLRASGSCSARPWSRGLGRSSPSSRSSSTSKTGPTREHG